MIVIGDRRLQTTRSADGTEIGLRSQPAWGPMVDLAPICVREWEAIVAAGLTVDRYRALTVPTLLLAGSENLDHPSMATKQLGASWAS